VSNGHSDISRDIGNLEQQLTDGISADLNTDIMTLSPLFLFLKQILIRIIIMPYASFNSVRKAKTASVVLILLYSHHLFALLFKTLIQSLPTLLINVIPRHFLA